MAQPRSCACFAQETKPRRFISQIPLADDLKGYRAAQIDVERLVRDPHRAATQFDCFFRLRPSPIHNAQSVAAPVRVSVGRFLERRLAGLRSVSCCLAEHAYRAEFHCSREFIATARAGALGLCAHAPNRRSVATSVEHKTTLHRAVRNRAAQSGGGDIRFADARHSLIVLRIAHQCNRILA